MNTAERIYVASASEGDSPSRLAADLARRIEDDIASLGLTPGGPLGSLRELSERYGVGRSVVREAIGLLERRGLGRMRPGPCGGFILARPRPDTIAAEIAEYFRATAVTPLQVLDAREVTSVLTGNPAAGPILPLMLECLNKLSLEATSPLAAAGNLSADIARRLAADIARNGSAGARLGSEWDLCERFQVSRLTLRQAIRLLQDSGLVECRRGRGNGLVVRDRRAAGCIRLVLAYLIAEGMDPIAVGTILFQLNCYIPALAVSRANVEQRRQLTDLLARVESCESLERYELLRLVQYVSRLADSPIIDLFSRCLAAYEARFHPFFAERLPVSAQASYFHLLRQLLQWLPVGDDSRLEWAKQQASACMLEMSLTRPL